MTGLFNPFRAPKSLPILNSSKFVKKKKVARCKGVFKTKTPGRMSSFLLCDIIFVVYLAGGSAHRFFFL